MTRIGKQHTGKAFSRTRRAWALYAKRDLLPPIAGGDHGHSVLAYGQAVCAGGSGRPAVTRTQLGWL
jgi:hypothetical protein